MIRKIQDLNPSKEELLDLDYQYQPDLTEKLDNNRREFDQKLINEIVLWKLNRYAELSTETLSLINKIDSDGTNMNIELTHKVLNALLNTKGIRLPMASTILRFKNPNIYQIIDQRVYRIIYGTRLKLKYRIDQSIKQYLGYLQELNRVCNTYHIPFSESDRILYEYDKIMNSKSITY